METVQIKDLAKRYFPNNADNENACYLAIVEALGKGSVIPSYYNIEIPPDNIATEVFKEALGLINKDAEGAYKIEVYEWMGWNTSCHSLRMKVCPIVVGRFFELGRLFWKMYEAKRYEKNKSC